MVRVVGGRAGGRRLAVPRGEAVRPTTDKVREALFNVLAHRFGDPVPGARVLDLFAGAGTLGIEALSRGAAEVVFVEADRRHARVVGENLAAVAGAVEGRGRVVQRAVEQFLGGALGGALGGEEGRFDLVFLDPPYAAGRVAPTLTALARGAWLADGALVCVEHPAGDDPVSPPPGTEVVFARVYGGCGLTILTTVESAGA